LPIGDITRVWWRQEDQARGSLHIHIVFWVAQGEGRAFDDTTTLPGDAAIRGTAPRECKTRQERAWRKFVRRVQRHDCRPKCFHSKGAACNECKYGCPRRRNYTVNSEGKPPRNTEGCQIDPKTGRYEYDCVHEEDERISPYVAEWLLAWGASMNIQRCTGTGFMNYTSKCVHISIRTVAPMKRALTPVYDVCCRYVPKAEPHGFFKDTPELRERKGMGSQVHFLNARVVLTTLARSYGLIDDGMVQARVGQNVSKCNDSWCGL
jgi:hypothetical protein